MEPAFSTDRKLSDTEQADHVQTDTSNPEQRKKEASYTYWVKNDKEQFPQHLNKDLIAPKKIDDPELLKKIESQQNANGSAWNKAGTWEDKKLKMETLKQYFATYLVDSEWTCFKDQLVATEIETCTGEASIICSRGKKRMGYELELKVKFTG